MHDITRKFPTDRALTPEETAYWTERAGKEGRPAVGVFAIQEMGVLVFVLQGKLDIAPEFATVRADTFIAVVNNALAATMGVQNLPGGGMLKGGG